MTASIGFFPAVIISSIFVTFGMYLIIEPNLLSILSGILLFLYGIVMFIGNLNQGFFSAQRLVIIFPFIGSIVYPKLNREEQNEK